MADFRHLVAIRNHRQIDIALNHRICLRLMISRLSYDTNLEHHGLHYGPFPDEGVVLHYTMPPSSPCGAIQTSHQRPPLHHMTLLTPTIIVLDRRRLLRPPSTPTVRTRPHTMIEERGECHPFFHYWPTRCPPPPRAPLFTTSIAATTTKMWE